MGSYDEQMYEGLAECVDDMVDFCVEVICAEERSPPYKDGVCYLEDTDVGLGVCIGKTADQFLCDLLANCMAYGRRGKDGVEGGAHLG